MLIAISGVILLNVVGLAWCYLLQSDKLTDLIYSLSFALIVCILWLNDPGSLIDHSPHLLVTAWAIRLGSYLFRRIHHMGNDKRFEQMRKEFSRISLFWLLQTVSILIIAIPLYAVSHYGIGPLVGIGSAIALVGLTIETIADQQKFTFRSNPANKNTFIQKGLWNWVQHPNYLGEILFWTGIAVCAIHLDWPMSFLAILSPLWISTLLIKISGIPLLRKAADKKYADLPSYKTYVEHTPVLFPYIY